MPLWWSRTPVPSCWGCQSGEEVETSVAEPMVWRSCRPASAGGTGRGNLQRVWRIDHGPGMRGKKKREMKNVNLGGDT